jgi:hypothetical protein
MVHAECEAQYSDDSLSALLRYVDGRTLRLFLAHRSGTVDDRAMLAVKPEGKIKRSG